MLLLMFSEAVLLQCCSRTVHHQGAEYIIEWLHLVISVQCINYYLIT